MRLLLVDLCQGSPFWPCPLPIKPDQPQLRVTSSLFFVACLLLFILTTNPPPDWNPCSESSDLVYRVPRMCLEGTQLPCPVRELPFHLNPPGRADQVHHMAVLIPKACTQTRSLLSPNWTFQHRMLRERAQFVDHGSNLGLLQL